MCLVILTFSINRVTLNGDEEAMVLTVTYLKGFSPVCVRMWLLRVVAPAKALPQ